MGHKTELGQRLMGPVMQIEREHHFTQIEQHMEDLKTLKGPIYDPLGVKHHFCEIEKHIESLKNLQGPVYDGNIERTHKYHERDHIKPDLKELNGPLYDMTANTFTKLFSLRNPNPQKKNAI